MKYATRDRDTYDQLVNRDLVWETDLRGEFSVAEYQTFNSALLKYILGHPSLKIMTDGSHGKIERTEYHGERSILADNAPPVVRLTQLLGRKIQTYLGRLPRDPNHPFLRRIDRDTKLGLGRMWGLVVSDATEASRHHHGDAFLSAIYYADIPEVMVGEDGPRAGWLEVGRPDFDIDMADEDIFYIEPKVGKLILFPSYFFHAVLPTRNKRPRVSIAFDVMLV